ncbi:MAG TPA: IS21 family transposase [Solirubrobacteraceae bacterium]|nr:IS21 family transposase [Solirubrobacteraceae bacterium]
MEEVRSAVEWAQVRALAADGVSQREIAARLGINRRTVKRLAEANEPPRYARASSGSMLDGLEVVISGLLEEWPGIKAPRVSELLRDDYGYGGSVDLVRKRMAALRPRQVRPAQRTGYRPGQVVQVDWAEMPTRPRIAGRERRVYALVCSLPFSGASTAHFTFDMTVESFLEGHVRAFEWLGGVPRECVYDNLRSAVARRDGDQVVWNARFVQLRGHYAFHATACTPGTPREKGAVEGAVRHLKTGFWPARRFCSLGELDEIYVDWRDRVALTRRHATARHIVAERLAHEREALRSLPPVGFDAAGRRSSRVALDGYLKHAASFYRAPEALVHQRAELRWDRDWVWIEHHGQTVARYSRSYVAGTWQPAPRMRPEPPTVAPAAVAIAVPDIVPPALSDYAELCA